MRRAGSRTNQLLVHTYFFNGCVEWKKALFEQLVHHFIIIRLDLGDHVTGDEAPAATDFCPVESICVLLSKHLDNTAGALIKLISLHS